MYPMYRDMNYYPYQSPSAPFNFPSWEAFRPQMKEDGANTRPMPEYWPSNCSYPSPMPGQNCCAHAQQPSYYNFRPPCPHLPMPPSYGHYYGGYPATYPQPYPYPYVPSPHYSMEIPRYEFDKGSPNAFHCCECPNHPPHVKSTSNVKIEEQDPDVEIKKVAPLIPAGLSSSPHPLMWAPPGYIMNKEQPRPIVDDEPLVEKPKKNIQPGEQDPNLKCQWLPLDLNSIKRLMEGGELMKPQEKKDGDEKKTAVVEKKDQNKQSSYPIIWMPFGGQGEDQTRGQEERNISKSPFVEAEERNKGKLPVDECPPIFKLLKHPDKELPEKRIESGDDPNGAGIRESRKTGNVKIIPVKQLDDVVPKSLKKEQEGEPNNSLKNVGSVKNGTDMKPSSPTKKSKLPPICLRVDPPRKKNGKGSSRSPSPPGEKRHQASSGSMEERKGKEKIQVNDVAGKDPKENGGVSHVTKEEKVVHTSDSSKLNATVCEDIAVRAQESQGVKESEHKESDASEKKILSETEAAVVLQSLYRGYAVRRLEPLRKLRHIANVKEEARKVSERVDKLESCDIVNDKEKVAIGEMIMNLLLKLDTIQGLHPSVRDVRKSVTKELIRLQEKLDSIVSTQVSVPMGPRSSGVEQDPNAFGSDEGSERSSEIISDASKTCREASTSEVPLSQSLESQVVVPPIGSSSEYEVLESWSEKKEPTESITPAEDPSKTMIQMDLSPDLKGTPGQFSDKDQEGNLDAEAPEENIENDIWRMEWECDLGAVKADREVNRGGAEEVSKEIEEQIADVSSPGVKCDEDVASAIEVEQVAPFQEPVNEVDKHVVKDGQVIEPVDSDSEDTPTQSDTGICYKDQDENVNKPSQRSLEEVEDDICRMEWECDIGAAKFAPCTDQEATQPAESQGLQKQASEVENSETEDQVDHVQSDDFDAVDTENHAIAEPCDEKNTETRESDTATGILDMDAHESEIPDGSMEVPKVEQEQEQAVPSLESVIEVEEQMITESPVSEGVKEECSLNLSTSSTETNKRIIEENEKLRSMVEQLLASGKDQQNVISTLTAKVNALEKKLPKRRNKMRSGKHPRVVLTGNDS